MTTNAAPTRRGLARLGLSALASLSLGGCFGDGLLGESPGPEKQSALDVSPVLLIATTRRSADPAGRPPYFTDQRGRGLSFATVRLAVPDR